MKQYHYFLFVLVAWSIAGCQADIRPDLLRQRAQSLDTQYARQLLQDVANDLYQSSGIPRWRDLTGAEYHLQDEYFGILGWMIRPWPHNPQDLVFRFEPAKDNGVIHFQDKTSGKTYSWGIHEWNAWSRNPGEPAVYGDDEVKFVVPTLQYFLEMPFRLADEAEIVDYAGEITQDGVTYHQVYATWGHYGPQNLIDQYVIWIRKSDNRMIRVDFTVRDKASFITGSVVYDDYRNVNGYLLPHRLSIGSMEENPSIMHRYIVKKIRLGIEIPRNEYVEDLGKQPASKH